MTGLVVASPEGIDDVEIDLAGSQISIFVSGYKNYHDENWRDWLQVLSPFLDYEYENDVEFIGEDDALWRFLVTEDELLEQNGRVVYD